MSTARSVYVAQGATVDAVRAAVADWQTTTGDRTEVFVESADDYPGYTVAVDLADSEDKIDESAYRLAAGIGVRLPQSVAVDIDLNRAIAEGKLAS